MALSAATDGFHLAYGRHGDSEHSSRAVVLLHGWPGNRTDFRHVVPLLTPDLDVVVPDLRGFGGSDNHAVDPAAAYEASGQARGIVALIEELGLHAPVVARDLRSRHGRGPSA